MKIFLPQNTPTHNFLPQTYFPPYNFKRCRCPDLEEDFVHDNDGLFPEVGFAGGGEGKHIVGEIPGEIGSHETCETAESEAGVIEIGRGDVLSDHVGGEHDDVQTFVERLGGCQVACSLGRGRGRRRRMGGEGKM